MLVAERVASMGRMGRSGHPGKGQVRDCVRVPDARRTPAGLGLGTHSTRDASIARWPIEHLKRQCFELLLDCVPAGRRARRGRGAPRPGAGAY